MKQRPREVTIRHLKTIIKSPQRGTERVGYAVETAARGGIGLEHDEGFSDLLCQSSIHQVVADGVHADSMRKVVGEDRLRVLRVSGAVAFLEAIVVWVSERRRA